MGTRHHTVVWSFTHHILTPALLNTVVGNLIDDATRVDAPGAREYVEAANAAAEAEAK